MKKNITIIGAGSWGTALALTLNSNRHRVKLWVRRNEYRIEMEKRQENFLYLPGFKLPEELVLTSELEIAVSEADFILCAVPSHVMRSVISRLRGITPPDAIWITATKGIEEKSNLTMSQLIREVLTDKEKSELKIVALSGPSFAAEVAQKKPTAVVAASKNKKAAQKVQDIFSASYPANEPIYFRVYTHSDILGVELGGAVKNVIAIAAGICDGLCLGMNARAALITRSLHETIRLGTALGARASTFSGLSGIGDLVLTCCGSLSRNRTVGLRIGGGETLDHILSGMNMVAEGIKNTVSILELGEKCNIEMPISSVVHDILFCGKSPDEAAKELMNRILKEEMNIA